MTTPGAGLEFSLGFRVQGFEGFRGLGFWGLRLRVLGFRVCRV